MICCFFIVFLSFLGFLSFALQTIHDNASYWLGIPFFLESRRELRTLNTNSGQFLDIFYVYTEYGNPPTTKPYKKNSNLGLTCLNSQTVWICHQSMKFYLIALYIRYHCYVATTNHSGFVLRIIQGE